MGQVVLAQPEVVADLVVHDFLDLLSQRRLTRIVEHERPPEDRDPAQAALVRRETSYDNVMPSCARLLNRRFWRHYQLKCYSMFASVALVRVSRLANSPPTIHVCQTGTEQPCELDKGKFKLKL